MAGDVKVTFDSVLPQLFDAADTSWQYQGVRGHLEVRGHLKVNCESEGQTEDISAVGKALLRLVLSIWYDGPDVTHFYIY